MTHLSDYLCAQNMIPMNRFLLILTILALCSILSTAQEPATRKQVVQQPGFTETYYVLKSDKETREGPYEKRSYSGKVLEEGSYHNNEMDGLWKVYYSSGQLQSTGPYREGFRVGKWEYYHPDGTVDQIFDHDAVAVVYQDASHPAELYVRDGEDFVKREMDVPTNYIGGFSSIRHFLASHIDYPRRDRDQGIQGTVKVSFVIGADNMARDHQVVQSVSEACDAEALRVIQMIPCDWMAGIYQGRHTDTRIILPVEFRLR